MDGMRWKLYLYLLLLVASALAVVTAPMALSAGIVFGLLIGNPWKVQSSRWSRWLLQGAVVGLGFGVPLREVLAKTGLRPLVQGVALWIVVSVVSAAAILGGWIS